MSTLRWALIGASTIADEWMVDAGVLTHAMDVELKRNKRNDSNERIRYEFALSIAVVRHLQLDPMLPYELTPEHWPGHTLRSTYHRFDGAFKQRMNEFLRRS